ncbi:beta-lactamase class D [Fodinibius roseus]|uniref:Beta-lactamase n=2 Tax=Fodinibius roseus TaxID=1194090 RepID=A0A1M5JW07_9BACT|nr:beta-lactamase class D [Fodinibius roseus]
MVSFGQDFNRHFNSLHLNGSTTIYDYNNKKWIFTDSLDAEKGTLPASTFKIPNSLIILESKVVANEKEIIKWDGTEKSHLGMVIEAWNQDTDLETAFKNSTVWFYVEASKKIKREQYIRTLQKLNYGNGNLKEKGNDFWNYGDFTVTPKNQIEYLIKLYENRLPFSKKNISIVKRIMISESSDSLTFRGKTGWTRKNGQDIGWWVGYLETNDNVYFFATRLTKDKNEKNPDFLSGRKEVTKRILKEIQAY